MEAFDTLKPGDEVTVTIYGPDGSKLYESTSEGHHKIEEAINDALAKASLDINPEDCVFEVSNHKSGVSHKYRFNAHGNLKLII